ncbi:MAG: NfeD family protein [Solirubrobacterales bacterium]
MLVLIAILLLAFVLSPAVGLVVLAAALAFEIGEIAIWRRWMRNRRVRTGSEAMPGEVAVVAEPCSPGQGTVRLRGEIWHARSAEPLPAGREVRVTAVHGLTLEVEPLNGGTEEGPGVKAPERRLNGGTEKGP